MDNENSTILDGPLVTYKIYNITIPKIEFQIFPPCTTAITVLVISILLYLLKCSALPKDTFKYLAVQHFMIGYLHIVCLTLFNFDFKLPFFNTIISEASSRLDLVSTYTSACIAWIIFLRLFLFKDGEDLYKIKGLILFSTLFLAIIQGYELLMSFFDEDTFLLSALRLTSILLIMCVSLSVFCITLICLLSPLVNISVPHSIFALFHLFLLILSDIALLRFNLSTDSQLPFLWDSLLYARLVVEVMWYFIHDRFLYNLMF